MACSTSEGARKRLFPPTYLLIALFIVVALRFLLPFWAYTSVVTLGVGCALLACGIALNLLSDSSLKKAATGVSPDSKPSALVADGVFRFTRNPMYLGMALIIAAAALLIGAPVGLGVALAFAWLMGRLFIPTEELNLTSVFGETYIAYRKSVRRWV